MNNKYGIFCFFVLCSILFFTGCRKEYEPVLTPPSTIEQQTPESTQEQVPPISTPAPQPEQTPLTNSDSTIDQEPIYEYESPKPTPPTSPQPIIETKPFWQSEDTMTFQNLKSVAIAAQQAYNDLSVKAGWISKEGVLYSYYTDTYITTNTLVELGYLQSGLSSDTYEILLLDGRDVANCSGTEVATEDLTFCIFAATKQQDSYLLSTATQKVGEITEISYQQLLAKYKQSHGVCGRLLSSSEEYGRILNFIGLYEGKLEEYFVRSIYKDDLYAVVTFSTKENTADIKQYILRNDNNFWEVVYNNLQSIYYPIVSVNRALPNFNLSLLPQYNLASWRSLLVRKNSSVIQALMTKGFITDESDIFYQCGTNTYFYVICTNGRRLVCYQSEGAWMVQPVESDTQANEFLQLLSGENYEFLLLDF